MEILHVQPQCCKFYEKEEEGDTVTTLNFTYGKDELITAFFFQFVEKSIKQTVLWIFKCFCSMLHNKNKYHKYSFNERKDQWIMIFTTIPRVPVLPNQSVSLESPLIPPLFSKIKHSSSPNHTGNHIYHISHVIMYRIYSILVNNLQQWKSGKSDPPEPLDMD